MKKLFVFTQNFPFDHGEEFLQGELIQLCEVFDKVYIVPTFVKYRASQREMPRNAILIQLGLKRYSKRKFLLFLENFFSTISELVNELLYSKFNWKSLRYVTRQSVYSNYLAEVINESLPFEEDSIFYSYWMNANAIAIAKLKKRGLFRGRFVFRTHGGDLYDERQLYGYLPFRKLCYSNADYIVTISKHGYKYIDSTFPFLGKKLKNSYLGVGDHGIGPVPKSKCLHIVSCSSVITLKRLDKIIDVLSHFQIPTRWTHIGVGPELEKINSKASACLPTHVGFRFLGPFLNETVIGYYQETPVDFFINLSSTEGLPVSLMEAASFGIPLVANDVGGVGEIVNTHTGILFHVDESPLIIATEIESFFSKMRSRDRDFRHGIREFWRSNFFAVKNYEAFVKQILQ